MLLDWEAQAQLERPDRRNPRETKAVSVAQAVRADRRVATLGRITPDVTGYDRTLRVFTFVDGGNVWGDWGQSLGANGLRYSYGAGLEWISPIGPLKLDVGFPITKHTGDQYQKFQFQIGTAF